MSASYLSCRVTKRIYLDVLLFNLRCMWDFFSQQSKLALQCVEGSCVQECCVPGRHCCAREQVFPSECLLRMVLCWLEYSVCPAVGMGQCSLELVDGGIMPPAAPRNQPPPAGLSGHQAGTAPAKVTPGLSTGHAPGSRGSLPCSGGHFWVFDKEKSAAPIFRKLGFQCGIYSGDTNIVLELKWLMFSWGGTRVMESSRVLPVPSLLLLLLLLFSLPQKITA